MTIGGGVGPLTVSFFGAFLHGFGGGGGGGQPHGSGAGAPQDILLLTIGWLFV